MEPDGPGRQFSFSRDALVRLHVKRVGGYLVRASFGAWPHPGSWYVKVASLWLPKLIRRENTRVFPKK